MAFFEGFGPIFGRLRAFANSVEMDVTKFNPEKHFRLQGEFINHGRAEILRMAEALLRSHYPNGDAPRILETLGQRAANQWAQRVTRAFSVAADAIPEFRNPVRAKNAQGQRVSILARLNRELGKGEVDPAPVIHRGSRKPGRRLLGIVRATRNKRRAVTLGLVPYMKTLRQTTPVNMRREFVSLLIKVRRKSGQTLNDTLYFVTAGTGPNICKTCKGLQGRVLTRAAIRYATTRLRPQLFHPNCRHSMQLKGLQGTRRHEYDESKLGPIVTITVIKKMVQSGQLDSGPPRTSPITL